MLRMRILDEALQFLRTPSSVSSRLLVSPTGTCIFAQYRQFSCGLRFGFLYVNRMFSVGVSLVVHFRDLLGQETDWKSEHSHRLSKVAKLSGKWWCPTSKRRKEKLIVKVPTLLVKQELLVA